MAKMVFRESMRISPEPQCVLIGRSHITHVAQGRNSKDRIDIWFELDADYERTLDEASRFVVVVPTGTRIPDDYLHIGTVVCDDDLVWHIYVERNADQWPQPTSPLLIPTEFSSMRL